MTCINRATFFLPLFYADQNPGKSHRGAVEDATHSNGTPDHIETLLKFVVPASQGCRAHYHFRNDARRAVGGVDL